MESLSAAWSRSVDFPMPGSPPMRTADPLTMPVFGGFSGFGASEMEVPPRTRSSSVMPVGRRSVSESDSSVLILEMGMAMGALFFSGAECCLWLASSCFVLVISSSESHWSQSGHLPIHRCCMLPHALQRYDFEFLAM